MGTPAQRAERLRVIAAEILGNVGNRELIEELIAEGYDLVAADLVAAEMETCEDCNAPPVPVDPVPPVLDTAALTAAGV